jgi:hypothetical protein
MKKRTAHAVADYILTLLVVLVKRSVRKIVTGPRKGSSRTSERTPGPL